MDVISYLTGITHAVSAYKTAVQTLDEAKIAAATNELTVQLMHFGAEILAMQKDGVQATQREASALARIRDLEEQVRELEKRNCDFSRYDLVEDYPGTFALRIKEAARDGEPTHYLCPGCRDNKAMKSILQFDGRSKRVAECPACNTRYRFQDVPTSRVANGEPGGWLGS